MKCDLCSGRGRIDVADLSRVPKLVGGTWVTPQKTVRCERCLGTGVMNGPAPAKEGR
jgi:hypothetical protein